MDNMQRIHNYEDKMPFEEQEDKYGVHRILHFMGISRYNNRGYLKIATVCLGLLCIILLIVIIVSHQKAKSGTAPSSDGTFEALTADNKTVVRDIVQLQALNRALNQQMNQLLATHNHLVLDQSQQLIRLNNVTENRYLLQIDYANLVIQRTELQFMLKNLTREREHLQASYDNLSRQTSELQKSHNLLIDEKARLQLSYDNLTTERQTENQNSKLMSRLADGWIARKNSIYKVSTIKRSWQDSKRNCENMGAHLVIVNDEDEQEFLLGYKTSWIGLSDLEQEGVWKWVDGTHLDSGFWDSGEPNNAGSEDCAEISANANQALTAWNDIPCSRKCIYICEDSI